MIRRIIISCLLLVLAIQPIWGQGYQESSTVVMVDSTTGKSSSYPIVNLMMGANDIISDVPGIVYPYQGAERTLVPIRIIAESLGAKVAWDEDQQRVMIQYGGNLIFLHVDKDYADVNGRRYALPDGVPAKRMDYDGASRILVPVRFITEQLGLKVQWVGRTSTVVIHREQQALTQMQYSGKGVFQEILLQTTGPVEPAVYTVAPQGKNTAYQLVLELPNTTLKYIDSTKIDKQGRAVLGVFERDIKKSEAYQVSGEAVPKVRVNITLDRARGYEVIRESKGIRIRFVNTVKSFYEEDIQGAKALVVLTSESPTYNVNTQGKQITIDILDTKISQEVASSATVKVDDGGIDNYQYSLMSGSALYGKEKLFTRLTVNLDSQELQDHVYIDDALGKLYVYVSQHPIGDFYYGKDGEASSMLSLVGNGAVKYQVQYTPESRELRLRIPEGFAAINDFESRPNDQLVELYSVTHKKGYYEIAITLEPGVTYVDRGKGAAKDAVELIFKNEVLKEAVIKNVAKEKWIVIDAGHGGKDPGAISKISGLKEKDLVLPVAIQVKKRLEAHGFNVYLTRDYDTYVDLYSRAEIANSIQASAFLSIHANSAVSTAHGVEMLYAPDERDSKNLAKSLQTALVEITGARDRGVVARGNLVVLRETKMPAVLAEIGFLSNLEEVEQLSTSAYLQKIVEGLTRGIIKYFDNE